MKVATDVCTSTMDMLADRVHRVVVRFPTTRLHVPSDPLSHALFKNAGRFSAENHLRKLAFSNDNIHFHFGGHKINLQTDTRIRFNDAN